MPPEPPIANVIGALPYASNATLLVDLDDGRRAVYKPIDGEQPLWDFPFGTLAAREVLAWETAHAMDLDIVPHTYLSDGPFGPGSVQVFINEDTQVDPRSLIQRPAERLWPFAVFDIVTNNADRKLGHILIEQTTGALWGIDNGLSFHVEPKLRTILWGFAGHEIPSLLLTAIERLQLALDEQFFGRIVDLLSQQEAEALADRTAKLATSGIHPHPPTDRPAVPWPMW